MLLASDLIRHAFVVWVVGALSVASAYAQDASELDRARAHHEAALSALAEGQLEVAETNFRAALDLVPRASTAYNLALVLHDRERFTDATNLFDQLLDGDFGDLPASADEVRAFRDRAAEHVATLTLRTDDAGPVNVMINDQARGTASRAEPLVLGLAAGRARILAENAGGSLYESTVVLAGGERATLSLEFDEEVASGSSELPWIIGGAVLILAGVTAALIVALQSDSPDSAGTPFPRFEALTQR